MGFFKVQGGHGIQVKRGQGACVGHFKVLCKLVVSSSKFGAMSRIEFKENHFLKHHQTEEIYNKSIEPNTENIDGAD
jgi:hypothetical protein